MSEHAPLQTRTMPSDARRQAGLPPGVQDVLGSPGQPLEPSLRADMEARFGHDFSRVRIHADAAAAESARSLRARAYTVGHDVVMGAVPRRMDDPSLRHLLAHELTHAIQQRPNSGAGASGAQVTAPHLEQQANAVAGRALMGQPIGAVSSPPTPVLQCQNHDASTQPPQISTAAVRDRLWRDLFRRQQGIIGAAEISRSRHAQYDREWLLHALPTLFGGVSRPDISIWDGAPRLARTATPILQRLTEAEDLGTVTSLARQAEAILMSAAGSYRDASQRWSYYLDGTITGAERGAIGVGVVAAAGIAIAGGAYLAPIVGPALAELGLQIAPGATTALLQPGAMAAAGEVVAGGLITTAETGSLGAGLTNVAIAMAPRLVTAAAARLAAPLALSLALAGAPSRMRTPLSSPRLPLVFDLEAPTAPTPPLRVRTPSSMPRPPLVLDADAPTGPIPGITLPTTTGAAPMRLAPQGAPTATAPTNPAVGLRLRMPTPGAGPRATTAASGVPLPVRPSGGTSPASQPQPTTTPSSQPPVTATAAPQATPPRAPGRRPRPSYGPSRARRFAAAVVASLSGEPMTEPIDLGGSRRRGSIATPYGTGVRPPRAQGVTTAQASSQSSSNAPAAGSMAAPSALPSARAVRVPTTGLGTGGLRPAHAASAQATTSTVVSGGRAPDVSATDLASTPADSAAPAAHATDMLASGAVGHAQPTPVATLHANQGSTTGPPADVIPGLELIDIGGLTESQAEAFYFEHIMGPGRATEVSLLLDVDSGTYYIIRGSAWRTDISPIVREIARRTGGRVILRSVAHYHPNVDLLQRLPSPSDFLFMRLFMIQGSEQLQARVERLDYIDQFGRLRSTTFGFDPSSSRPYWVRYRANNGSWQVRDFVAFPFNRGSDYRSFLGIFTGGANDVVPSLAPGVATEPNQTDLFDATLRQPGRTSQPPPPSQAAQPAQAARPPLPPLAAIAPTPELQVLLSAPLGSPDWSASQSSAVLTATQMEYFLTRCANDPRMQGIRWIRNALPGLGSDPSESDVQTLLLQWTLQTRTRIIFVDEISSNGASWRSDGRDRLLGAVPGRQGALLIPRSLLAGPVERNGGLLQELLHELCFWMVGGDAGSHRLQGAHTRIGAGRLLEWMVFLGVSPREIIRLTTAGPRPLAQALQAGGYQ